MALGMVEKLQQHRDGFTVFDIVVAVSTGNGVGPPQGCRQSTVGLFCYSIFIFNSVYMEQQAGVKKSQLGTMKIIIFIFFGLLVVGLLAGLTEETRSKQEREQFVASLETPAFDAKTVLGASASEAEAILGAPSPEIKKATPVIVEILGSKLLAGTTSTFWKKEDFIIWTTALNKKPIDQICIIDPKSKYKTDEILKKVSLASSTDQYSILGVGDGNGFCVCIKKSQNPFCKDQAKTIADKNARQEKIEKVCAEHKDWEERICENVVDEEVSIGMTPEQALAAWGLPTDINRTIRSGSRQEQWVYGLGTYIYFTNGVLTSMQN